DSIAVAGMGLAPVGRTVEGAAPDAALGVLSLALSRLIGIAGRSAEIDGVARAHHRLAEVGHALRAAYGDDAAIVVGRARLAIHPARLQKRGELRLRRAAAQPGLAVGILAGLVQLRRIDAEQTVFVAVTRADRVAVDRRDLRVRTEGGRLIAAIALDEEGEDDDKNERDQLAEHLGKRLRGLALVARILAPGRRLGRRGLSAYLAV